MSEEIDGTHANKCQSIVHFKSIAENFLFYFIFLRNRLWKEQKKKSSPALAVETKIYFHLKSDKEQTNRPLFAQ